MSPVSAPLLATGSLVQNHGTDRDKLAAAARQVVSGRLTAGLERHLAAIMAASTADDRLARCLDQHRLGCLVPFVAAQLALRAHMVEGCVERDLGGMAVAARFSLSQPRLGLCPRKMHRRGVRVRSLARVRLVVPPEPRLSGFLC